MDTRAIKPEDNKGGTFTQQLTDVEETTAYVSPVPSIAPGIIWAEPGTVNEEAIYFKTRDAGAGTIGGLIRDFTQLNGGDGREHQNGEDWEVMQSARTVQNIVDILNEGFIREQQTIVRVDADEFTVVGNFAIVYSAGRLLRCNEDNAEIVSVISSSYSAGTGLTTVVIAGTLPNPLNIIEFGIQPKTALYVTPDGPAELNNKTLNEPVIIDPAMRTVDDETLPWKSITLVPGFIKPTTTGGCNDPEKVEAGTNDVDYDTLDFDQSTDERAYCNVHMPESYEGGDPIQFRFIWTAAGGSAAQTAVLEMKARAYANDDAIDQAGGTAIEVSDALIATGDVHISDWSADVTPAGSPDGSQLLHLEFMRDVSEDNLAADMRLIAVQIRYRQNAITD